MSDEIICPYCNHVYTESWDLHLTGEPEDIECEECGKVFKAWVEYYPNYCEEK